MNSVRETAVGIFVLLGLICVAYLAIKLGRMEFFANQGFELSARFDSASGLRVGADVELAGVPVGRVVQWSICAWTKTCIFPTTASLPLKPAA